MNMDRGRSEENLRQQQDQQQPVLLRPKPPESHMAAAHDHHHQPPPLHKCPRCDSSNTKFCYYNNYSLSQPRYFCKACRRYWTQGGTLRNVPVGGGCRKSKRAKTSSSSLSNSLSARTQGLSPALRSQNLTAMISGQPSRPMPPAIPPPMGNSFYTGGSFLSSLSAMQSFPAGGSNQGAAVNLGGGSGQFGAHMALLHGISLPSLKSQAAPPHQFQPPTHFFPPQQSLIPPGPFSSWTQSVINAGAASSSAATSSFWSCNTAGGNDQAGSSFNPNQWSDSHPGFNSSQ